MTQQEQIVDGIIADYLETKFSGVKEKLSKTSKYFKRGAKASILGTDRKMYELIKTLEEKNESEEYLTYFDELVNAYREYVEVADCEVKTHGEVMTPIWLVEDMLNTLPSDVWSNPNLKWLDPCSGVGTYSSIVVQRLMKGLETFEPNPVKRYRHIIEEMIYVCELQPKNMFIFQCVFDKDDTNELNTYCGSFLDENFDKHMTNVWGVEKFDIVMGNPPYNSSKEGQKKTQPIWHLFVNKSLGILIDGGYLNMVHPSGWRNVDGKFKNTQKLMTSKHIQYLEIHGTDDGLKTFGAKTRYDFYCLNNVDGFNKTTTIKCQNGEIEQQKLYDIDFIPNQSFDLINQFKANDNEEKVIVINDSSYHTQRDYIKSIKCEEYKYPCVDNVTTKLEIGKTYYSNTNTNGHFGIPKIVLGSFGINPYIDTDGVYGMTQHGICIIDEPKNLPLIKKALLNPRFIELNKITDVNGIGDVPLNKKVLSTFRKDFYKQFLND